MKDLIKICRETERKKKINFIALNYRTRSILFVSLKRQKMISCNSILFIFNNLLTLAYTNSCGNFALFFKLICFILIEFACIAHSFYSFVKHSKNLELIFAAKCCAKKTFIVGKIIGKRINRRRCCFDVFW